MDYREINFRDKARCMARYLSRQREYKKKRKISILLYGVAAVIVCAFTALFALLSAADASTSIPSPLVGLLLGLLSGLIPFLIGRAISIRAAKSCGRPFSERTNEFLCLEEDALRCGFHPTEAENPEEMLVYRIRYADIRGIDFDRETQVLSILGEGEITVYDDLLMTVPSREREGRRLYENSAYQIMLATDKAAQIAALLKDNSLGGT